MKYDLFYTICAPVGSLPHSTPLTPRVGLENHVVELHARKAVQT